MAAQKNKRLGKSPVNNRIVELETAIAGVREGRKTSPRTARLLEGDLPKMAQKLAEEATEVVIEAVRGERSAVIHESVDLLYHLVVLWSELGITSPEIWAEMDRRQALFGVAEKLPKEVGVGATSFAGH
jgi:phosphoribosyl-ATP pyrophosphohydrolase